MHRQENEMIFGTKTDHAGTQQWSNTQVEGPHSLTLCKALCFTFSLRGRQLAKVNNCEQLWGSRPDDLYGLSFSSAESSA
jgi:hypothetical protein